MILRGKTAAFLLFAGLSLAGCQSEVYTGLSEREVNDMYALLDGYGIPADKAPAGQELYKISVARDDFARAITLLKARGHPRRARTSLAELFQPAGLVATPFEERVRYLYGLAEELAHTISLFDGVIDTRVHVVLPENNASATGATRVPGKASVYIKYDQSFDIAGLVPQIRKLVSDSAEGVSHEHVEMLAIPAYIHLQPASPQDRFYHLPAGIKVDKAYRLEFFLFAAGLALVVVQSVVLALTFFLLYRRQKQRQAANAAG